MILLGMYDVFVFSLCLIRFFRSLLCVCNAVLKKYVVEEKEPVARKKESFLIWDKTTHVEISTPQTMCAAFKYANWKTEKK